ncbi:hypothetical protein ER308_04420 [Egibacter rhizosphaerae]|uniref:Uncharacterized protein n=1 Tax=Egibacter rhizosphaerae TaxID=1670831 RepID=A0A411YC95_9ACTN|nr:hypothetical protein [Egibacter rhizosphaerae]QBI18861.1 hypothetical protein ER308_04420 [Egibacter rhizosphaerae]
MTPSARPRPALELTASQAFVLLAPGGVGKTTVLQALRTLEPDAIEIPLRRLDRSRMHDRLVEVAAHGVPIYLDAIDEAALYEEATHRVLQEHLAAPEARSAPWRLACRPAAWNPALAEQLGAALPAFEEFRLLPLSRPAARRITAEVVSDPDAFLRALTEARLGRLAATPSQLLAAARQWERSGDLPASHLEAIRFEIRHLLAEHDSVRSSRQAMPADRQHRLAARLGAIAMLTGSRAFSTATALRVDATSVHTLPSDPEPEQPGIPLTSDDYEAVLDTALFDAAPDGTIEFRHQQYAEHLAATYLTGRGITRRQLHDLLGVHYDVLPGSMVGVAAWLAALNPGLVDDLVAANALAFVQAGVELPSEGVLAAIVDRLLEQAAAGELDPAWQADLAPLAHSGLEAQLGAELDRGLTHSCGLWWVAALAAAGDCRDLADELNAAARDPQWAPWARLVCVQAVDVLADADQRRALTPLLYLGPDEDPDDQLLAGVVSALYPQQLETRELLAALRPRRWPDLVGNYLVLLGQLPDHIPDQDLPDVLEWAAEHVSDEEDAYGRLIPQLVRRAWACRRIATVLGSLARLLAAMSPSDSHRWAPREALPWLEQVDDNARRRLAEAVAVEAPDDDVCLTLLDLRLITTEDVEWLLDSLPGLPATAREPLAACVPYLLGQPTAKTADLVLTLPEQHPAYLATDHLRGSRSVQSEPARRWRRHREREAEAEATRATTDERREHLVAALEAAEVDTEAWWRVTYWLAQGEDPPTGDALFSHDLTRRPGWQLLTEEGHDRVIAVGLEYLRTHGLAPLNWQGRARITTGEALVDWAGVYLLTTLVRHCAETLADLDTALWVPWAPAIIGAWNFDRDEDASLRGALLDAAPLESRDALLAAALNDLDARQDHERNGLLPTGFEHLVDDLAPNLHDRLVARRYHGELAHRILDLLIEHAPERAVETCRQLATHADAELALPARQGLAGLEPATTVAELTTTRSESGDLVAVVPKLPLERLGSGDLNELARLLLDRFPFADDPPTPSTYVSNPWIETRETRRRVLERLADTGRFDDLRELAAHRPDPDRDILRRYARRARIRAADLAFEPPNPHGLLHLLARADARLIRSSADLLEVVIEHLHTIEGKLQHQHASRYLWNLGPAEARPKSEDEISEWIRGELETRLGGGSVVDREIEVARRSPGGLGTRIDLTATRTTATQPAHTARVVIEAKHLNNRRLLTALHDQLVTQYLIPSGSTHAIYLVYWVPTHQRPGDWPASIPGSQAALETQLDEQTTQLGADLTVRPFLLNISRPSGG